MPRVVRIPYPAAHVFCITLYTGRSFVTMSYPKYLVILGTFISLYWWCTQNFSYKTRLLYICLLFGVLFVRCFSGLHCSSMHVCTFPPCLSFVVIVCIFRYWSEDDLKEKVLYNVNYHRSRPVTTESLVLVPHVPGIWGTNDKLAKAEIVKAVAGISSSEKCSDTACMNRFLKNSLDSHFLIDPDLVSFDEMITPKTVLLDLLSYDVGRNDSWDFPGQDTLAEWRKKRGVSYKYLEEIEVREIIVGRATEEEISEFSDWVFSKIASNSEVMDTGALSFDVEDLKISEFDFARMLSPGYRTTDIVLARSLNQYSKEESKMFEERKGTDAWMNLPVKIMFGDGIDWVGMISFEIVETRRGMVYTCHDINHSIIDFLENLPIVYGLNIRMDVMDVEEKYGMLSGRKDFKMAGFVDLQNLAILAGWQLKTRNMTAMSLIVLGGTLNKICSVADGLWGIPYAKLPRSLQVYAVADIKFGHMTYHVLLSLLLRQLFPDPDIVCYISDIQQSQFVSWFCHWIRDALFGTAVHDIEFLAAYTRLDMALSIKYRDLYGKISNHTPERIRCIQRMVYWPSLSAGGPRFLQPVRIKYLEHYEVLRHSQMSKAQFLFKRELTAHDFLYASYGHQHLCAFDVDLPVPRNPRGTGTLHLVCHPDLADRLIHMNMKDLAPANFCREAARKKRDVPQAMLEWMRLRVGNIVSFFDACQKCPVMAKYYRPKYETFRLLHLRITNKSLPPIPAIEEFILEDHRRAVSEVDLRLEKIRRDLVYCEELKSRLEEVKEPPLYRHRTDWKVWAVDNKPAKLKLPPSVPSCSRKRSRSKSVKSRLGRSQSRSRIRTASPNRTVNLSSRSVKSRLGGAVSRSRSRASTPHRGRSLAVKLESFRDYHQEVVGDPSIPFRARSRSREPDEHASGGRFAKSKNRKNKRKVSAEPARLMTQDEIEEEVSHSFEPEPDYFNYDF